MDFNLTEEQIMMRDSAERYVRENCSIEKRRALIEQQCAYAPLAWSTFADLGWLALPISEEYGGLGGSIVDTAMMLTELGRGLCVEPIVTNSLLCADVIAGAGWAGATALLEDMAWGRKKIALAHFEGGEQRLRPNQISTCATATEAGMVLNGRKDLVWDLDGADYIILSAVDERGDLMLLLVSTDRLTDGTETYPLIDGSRGGDLVIKHFDLALSDVLACGSHAEDLLSRALNRAVIGNLALSLGAMEQSLEICAQYVRERVQFGQIIGKFQALQHMMADMLVMEQEARSMLYYALSAIQSDAVGCGNDLAQAQMIINRAAAEIGRMGIQLHGGYGMTDEFAIGHYYRYALGLEKKFTAGSGQVAVAIKQG